MNEQQASRTEALRREIAFRLPLTKDYLLRLLDDALQEAARPLPEPQYGGLIATLDNATAQGLTVHVATRATCAEHLEHGDDKATEPLTAAAFGALPEPQPDRLADAYDRGWTAGRESVRRALPDRPEPSLNVDLIEQTLQELWRVREADGSLTYTIPVPPNNETARAFSAVYHRLSQPPDPATQENTDG